MAKDKQAELDQKLAQNEQKRIGNDGKPRERHNEEQYRQKVQEEMNKEKARKKNEIQNQPTSEVNNVPLAHSKVQEYMSPDKSVTFDDEYLIGLSTSLKYLSHNFELNESVFETDVKDCITNTDVVTHIYNAQDGEVSIKLMFDRLNAFKALLEKDAGNIDQITVLSGLFDHSLEESIKV